MLEETSLERTQNVLDVSVTERATFKTCRRRWDLQVLENLTPETPTTFELEFGSGIHQALEDYYIAKSNIPAYPPGKGPQPLKVALDQWDRWYEDTQVAIDSDKRLPSQTRDTLLDQLVELGDLGEEMLRGYRQFAEPIDKFTIHAIEGRQTGAGKSWLRKHWEDREFIAENSQNSVRWHEPSRRLLVPILHPKKQRPLKNGAMLSMRIDLLVLSSDAGLRGLWIYDHKTSSSSPNERGLDFDDQITAYCYGVWRWLGILPRGVCFNFLIKQPPKEPRVLSKGQLSSAKDQLTTPDRYRKELIARGLMLKSGEVSDERPTKQSPTYIEAYEALLSRGWDPFFQRQYVTRNTHEIRNFEQRLYDEYFDMVDCFNGDLAMYPNFSRLWCPGCRVSSICQAMEDGSDVESIIEQRYIQAPDRKASL